MSNDVSRVYQFLANVGDWKTKADKDGDGTIIKSEFSTFMENNYEWDGETTTAGKNDLINSFWKTIDTNQSGKLPGTKFKNKNALDSKEIDAMQDRIAIYERLNTYVADIQVPNEISDKAGWKKSISASLANTTETLIKQGVTADTLVEELDKIIENVKNKTTADYCANEYLNTSMKDIVKQYGYAYADDATLKGIIDNFVNNLPEDSDSASIKQTVEEIINAYMATATGDGSEDISILEQYGYTPSNNTAMNDLQKSIVKTKLTEALADLKNEADYKNNSALYETAINEYIEAMLNDKTYGDYTNNAIEYSLQAFKDSETGKALEKTLKVKNLFNSDELKTALTNKFSDAIAKQLSGSMTSAFPAYDEIKAQALEKAQKGDFDSADGNLDINKAIEWITEEVNNKLTEIFANNMNKLALSDLATIYDKSADAAKQNDDIAALRKAAISYCDSVAKRSTKLAEVVKEIFGNTYSTEINSMSNVDIEAKMTDLKAKVEEFGDISKMTDAEKNALVAGLKDSYSFEQNATDNKIQLPRSITCNGKSITTDKITYTGSGCVSVNDSGLVTIDTSKPGTYSGKVNVSIDDKIIATKTITVTVQESASSIISKTTDKQLPLNETVDNWNTDANFQNLYNGDKTVILGGWMDSGNKKSWDKVKDTLETNLTNLGSQVIDILTTAGLDKTKLYTALQTVVRKYMDVGPIYNRNDKGTKRSSIINNCNNYMSDNRNNTKSRVVWTSDHDGADSHVYMIHFKDFVDDIIAEYKKLVG